MPGHNFILIAWEREVKVFFSNLSLIRQQPGKIAVHDLRVSVKRLRSYLALNQEICGLDFRENFKGLKNFFAVAGKYRDTQMALSLAKKYKRPPHHSFAQYLENFHPIAEQWTRESANAFDIAIISRLQIILNDGIGKTENPELRKLTRLVIEKKLQEVKLLSGAFNHNAHRIRKILKMLFYWLQVLPPPSFLGEKEMKNLEELLDHLGKWQDHMVLIDKMRQFRKHWLTQGTTLHKQCREWEAELYNEADKLLADARRHTDMLREHFFP